MFAKNQLRDFDDDDDMGMIRGTKFLIKSRRMLFEMVNSSLRQRKSPMWQNITCYRSYVGQDDKFVFIAEKKAAYLYVTHFWHFSSEFLGKKNTNFPNYR